MIIFLLKTTFKETSKFQSAESVFGFLNNARATKYDSFLFEGELYALSIKEYGQVIFYKSKGDIVEKNNSFFEKIKHIHFQI